MPFSARVRCRPVSIAFGLALACLNAVSALAQGAPVLVTDDPGTPGHGRWEVNLAWISERGPDEKQSQLPWVEVNYGLGERAQIKYATAFLIQRPKEASRRKGLDQSLVGMKWRFLEGDDAPFQLSVHPQFQFRNPGSSSVRKELVDDENVLVLPLQAQVDFGPYWAFAEVGWTLPSKSADEWFFGLALCRALGPSLSFGAEVTGGGSNSFDQVSLAVGVGAHLALGSRSALIVTVGREVSGGAEPAIDLNLLLGIQLQL